MWSAVLGVVTLDPMSDPTSLPSFPPPAAENPLRDRIVDALQQEGFRPEVDSDGDVSFKVEGQQLFAHCAEGDLPVMRVFGQWQIGEDLPADELSQLRGTNEVTLRMNIVKAGLNNGTLVVTSEHIVPPEFDVRPLLAISTQLVLTGVQLWHQLMMGVDVFGDNPPVEEE